MFGDQKDSLHEYDHAKGGINQYYLAMFFQSKWHFQFLKEKVFFRLVFLFQATSPLISALQQFLGHEKQLYWSLKRLRKLWLIKQHGCILEKLIGTEFS